MVIRSWIFLRSNGLGFIIKCKLALAVVLRRNSVTIVLASFAVYLAFTWWRPDDAGRTYLASDRPSELDP
jgi:hypothetical protein